MAPADLPIKRPPAYAIASVDHALRVAAMLQLEGPLTVSQVADRLDVARSTAHRLLAMLVYRDFAVQDDSRAYRAGPVLELAAHSRSATARLREAGLPHLRHVVELLEESANLCVRVGATARFVASVECGHALRVGSREGMVFPAHRTTAGQLLLAELSAEELESVYAAERYVEEPAERPDLARLGTALARVRRAGFAVNRGLSERGVVAVGVAVRDSASQAVAGLSVSLPGARYDRHRLPALVGALRTAARALESDLRYSAPRNPSEPGAALAP